MIFEEASDEVRAARIKRSREAASSARYGQVGTARRAGLARRIVRELPEWHPQVPDAIIPSKGYWVYVLRTVSNEVLYVGQSASLLSRLGSHMRDLAKRNQVYRVDLYECASREEMDLLELKMIRFYKPPMNTQGVA